MTTVTATTKVLAEAAAAMTSACATNTSFQCNCAYRCRLSLSFLSLSLYRYVFVWVCVVCDSMYDASSGNFPMLWVSKNLKNSKKNIQSLTIKYKYKTKVIFVPMVLNDDGSSPHIRCLFSILHHPSRSSVLYRSTHKPTHIVHSIHLSIYSSKTSLHLKKSEISPISKCNYR